VTAAIGATPVLPLLDFSWPTIVRRALGPRGVVAAPNHRASEDPDVVHMREQRHPAMARIDISPVHGRNCICDQCQRPQRELA